MKKIFCLSVMAWFLIAISSCRHDPDNEPDSTNPGDYFNLMVVNEGSFGSGNAELSLINTTTDSVMNAAFSLLNNRPLGDVAQSVAPINDEWWVVVNNSQKIEVLDATTLLSKASITGFSSPRYLADNGSGKAIVSNLFAEEIEEINTATYAISATHIEDCSQPSIYDCGNEMCAFAQGKWWLANQAQDKIIARNNVLDEVFSTSLNANPQSLLRDSDGNIWVLTYDFTGVEPVRIYKLNGTDGQIVASLDMPAGTPYASQNMVLSPDAQNLYILGNHIYHIHTPSSTPTLEQICSYTATAPYGLGIDAEGSFLYLCEAGDFVSPGAVIRISLATCEEVNRYTVGINPAKIVLLPH